MSSLLSAIFRFFSSRNHQSDQVDLITTATANSGLRCRKLRIHRLCPHNSSPVYGCDRCPLPPYNFNAPQSPLVDRIPTYPTTQLAHLNPLLWWQYLIMNTENHNLTGNALSSMQQSSGPVYHISVRLTDGYRIAHDRVSARAYWWGYSIFFPRPTLDRLYTGNNVLIALAGMMSSVSVVMVPVLLPVMSSLASYFVLEGSIIRGLDRGFGVTISASWAVPIMFWPRPMPPPEVYAIYDPVALASTGERITDLLDDGCDVGGGNGVNLQRRRALGARGASRRQRPQRSWRKALLLGLICKANDWVSLVRQRDFLWPAVRCGKQMLLHPLTLFALSFWSTGWLLNHTRIACHNPSICQLFQ